MILSASSAAAQCPFSIIADLPYTPSSLRGPSSPPSPLTHTHTLPLYIPDRLILLSHIFSLRYPLIYTNPLVPTPLTFSFQPFFFVLSFPLFFPLSLFPYSHSFLSFFPFFLLPFLFRFYYFTFLNFLSFCDSHFLTLYPLCILSLLSFFLSFTISLSPTP